MTDFERLRATLPTGLWIDGAQTDPIDGGTFPVYDPATGTLIADVADAGGKDAMRALDSAAAVQEEWAATAAAAAVDHPAVRVGEGHRAHRRPRAADDDGDGQGRCRRAAAR